MSYRIAIADHTEVKKDAWQRFTLNTDNALPFSLWEYNNLYAAKDVFYVFAVDERTDEYIAGITGRIKGKLPLIGSFFSVLLLETSVLVHKSIANGDDIKKIKYEIYKTLVAFATQKRTLQIYLNHWSREKDAELLKSLGFTVSENHTFEINTKDIDGDVISHYSGNCRNTIKKAQKNGVSVSIVPGPLLESIAEEINKLSYNTYKRAHNNKKGSSMQMKSASFFESLFFSLKEHALTGLGYAPENVLASFAIMLKTSKNMVYYRGGSDMIYNRKYAVSNIVIHELIEHAITNNLDIIDLGGVPANPDKTHPAYGVFKFKKSFGGTLKVYYGGNKIINPMRYKLFNILFKNKTLLRIYNKLKPVS